VRDAQALGRALHFSWVIVMDLSEVSAALLPLAQDDSVDTLSAADRSDLLRNALRSGFDAIGVALFQKGFRMEDSNSMLFFAASGGCAEVVKLLCTGPAPGISVNARFGNSQSALHITCQHGRNKAALTLLELGATVDVGGAAGDAFAMSPLA